MKSLKSIAILLVCFWAAGLLTVGGQSRAKAFKSPEALVADLYRAKGKRSPFFQTRSRALVYKYFEKDLVDLIWHDAVKSKGEVGVIDGDPLYDAQDMEIKNFFINKPRYEAGQALVDVTFENFGQKKTVTFALVKGASGWRIHDIVYGEGRTLRSEFKESS
ncbi:MAG TPA: DUF3828 domain-containing protein [Pyrinomonadaceae bacterium]|jgi:hypothetical protein|nr:DUF3828 domain-containing protein [Pyrinomonadaceae bacterium]